MKDDLISRQAAIDAIRKIYDSVGILGEKWAVDKCQMAIKDLPSAQPETSILTVTVNPDSEEIERVAREIKDAPVMVLPSAQPEQRWIPFKTRPLTKEEKEEHPEWDGILDCKLPDDGQRILVNVSVRGHESVQYDEFYTDDGSYLDSGYEIGTEATAWMPLPEPYTRVKDRDDGEKDDNKH